MARRKDQPIEVKAYVTVNGEKVDVDTLSPEMRKELATWLKLTWMNAMFRGKAVFTVADKTANQQGDECTESQEKE